MLKLYKQKVKSKVSRRTLISSNSAGKRFRSASNLSTVAAQLDLFEFKFLSSTYSGICYVILHTYSCSFIFY